MNTERNMYDCTDCPQCGSKYRSPTQSKHPIHPNSVICDDCGLIEPIDGKNFTNYEEDQ